MHKYNRKNNYTKEGGVHTDTTHKFLKAHELLQLSFEGQITGQMDNVIWNSISKWYHTHAICCFEVVGSGKRSEERERV